MKTFKYSTIITLILTFVSAFAIFVIDDVIPGIVSDPIKSHVLENLDNYNAFLFGIFTGSLVSFIVAVVGYATERRRVIAEIWNNARKLTIDFKLLLIDNIDFKDLTHDKLSEIIEDQQGFNQQVREWLTFYSAPYMLSIMELDFLINYGDTASLIKTLERNIQILRNVVDGFMNAYLNKRLSGNYGDVDIEKLFVVITNQDENQVLQTVENILDDIVAILNKK